MFSFTFLLGEDEPNLTTVIFFQIGLGSIQPPARNQILWCLWVGFRSVGWRSQWQFHPAMTWISSPTVQARVIQVNSHPRGTCMASYICFLYVFIRKLNKNSIIYDIRCKMCCMSIKNCTYKFLCLQVSRGLEYGILHQQMKPLESQKYNISEFLFLDFFLSTPHPQRLCPKVLRQTARQTCRLHCYHREWQADGYEP